MTLLYQILVCYIIKNVNGYRLKEGEINTMNYHRLAKSILDKVGGKDNINEVWHCATRLRFRLKDESICKTAEIENLDGVVTVVQSAGQYQVVIGNSVGKVYDELISLTGDFTTQSTSEDSDNKHKENILNKFFSFVSGVFTPFLGALAASGILKGFITLAVTMNWMSNKSGQYIILNAASDAIFYFLPIFIAFTAAKVLKIDRFVAVAIAAALVYPSLVTAMSGKSAIHFFGIPVSALTYSSTVIPILLALWFLSYLQPIFDKIFPEAIRNIFTPLLSLVIMVPLTLLVVGPLGNGISDILAKALAAVHNFSPLVAGALLGAFHQVMVIFGVHWALIALMINNIATIGKDPWLPIVCIAVFSQAGAALGVFFKTKDKKLKTLAGSSFLTAIFGITEPAIYGVNLKLKKPMYIAIGSGAIGGAIAGFGQVEANTFTFPSILAIPTYLGRGFNFEIIGLIVSFVLAVIGTYLFGVNDSKAKMQKSAPISGVDLYQPVEGKAIPLSEVNDEVFSSGKMGQGYAIKPSNDVVRAPFDSTVEALFPTGHAIGLKTSDGNEFLIHIGINTVDLRGKYFKTFVKQGDFVVQGQKLIKFDYKQIQNAGYDDTVMVILTNKGQEK